MTPTQRLLALFDLAYETHTDVVIWEHDEPEAPSALVAWGNGRDVGVIAKSIDIGSSDRTLDVPKVGRRGRITVYCKRQERAA